jgi:hypothetical protein
MAARGVFAIEANAGTNTYLTNTTPGPSIEDLTIEFDQVDTSVKANLIQFPPAIYVTNTLRWRVTRVRLQRGWDGIYAYDDITGNASGVHNGVGGGYIYDLFGGCLNTNIYIDGSSDSLHIDGCHFWPFGCTSNQTDLFRTVTVGIVIGRADDFHISNIGAYIWLAIRLIQTANGSNYGEITNIDFDTSNGIQMVAGNATISACQFLVGANLVGLSITGNANVVMSGVSFSAQSAGAAAIQCLPASGTSATLSMSGFVVGVDLNDSPAVNINSNASPGTSIVTLTGGSFQASATTGRGAAVVLCQSNTATLVMSGCQINPKVVGGPSGLFVQIIGNGTGHRIIGNSSPGWPNSIPAGCAYDYPNFYQQAGGAADLNTAPVPWSGFGLRNYITPTSQTNWPPNTGPSLAVLDSYTANTQWGVQLSFGYSSDGLWHRWQTTGTWQPWYQIVTTYGGQTMKGNLVFENGTALRFLDSADTAAMTFSLLSTNSFVFNGIGASGGVRNIFTMAQMSDTSPLQAGVDVQLMARVGFNTTAPIAKPAVAGAWAGNTAGKALCVALASYGLITDNTTA